MTTLTSWLIFTKGNGWPRKILKNGFGHLSVLRRDKYNWFYFDPTGYYLDFNILGLKKEEDAVKQIYETMDCKIIKLVTEFDKEKVVRVNMVSFFVNCVDVCEYLCGIRTYKKTPYQLWKHLLSGKKIQNVICAEQYRG